MACSTLFPRSDGACTRREVRIQVPPAAGVGGEDSAVLPRAESSGARRHGHASKSGAVEQAGLRGTDENQRAHPVEGEPCALGERDVGQRSAVTGVADENMRPHLQSHGRPAAEPGRSRAPVDVSLWQRGRPPCSTGRGIERDEVPFGGDEGHDLVFAPRGRRGHRDP